MAGIFVIWTSIARTVDALQEALSAREVRLPFR